LPRGDRLETPIRNDHIAKEYTDKQAQQETEEKNAVVVEGTLKLPCRARDSVISFTTCRLMRKHTTGSVPAGY
jgi:hypothetical protein